MIRVEVLGGLRVFDERGEVGGISTKPKRTALLTYLAVEREAKRDKICFLLWPDSHESGARHTLSQTLFELKRELGSAWLEIRGERIVATRELAVDLEELDGVIARGEATQAIELYRGPFLDGVQLAGGVELERWIEDKRSEVHRKVRNAFRAATGEAPLPGARAGYARAWVALDPLDDEAQHALIEALAACGDRSGALQQYQEYEALIREQLEVEPLDQTKHLVDRIKRGKIAKSSRPEARSDGSQAPAAEPPQASGTRGDEPRFGPDLRAIRPVRRGSTGTVYLAREPALRRQVAVKVLRAELAAHGTASARFEREAQSAARILHPHVATVYRVGVTQDGRPFFVMPYVKGVTLADHLKARGTLRAHEVVRVLSEVASALAAAHAVGVIHRDVRPANVLYEEETGRTYLADFGIAAVFDSSSEEVTRLTEKGEVLGDPEYISPEQQEGDEVDGRSDVYSLGVMGCELLCGRATRDPVQLEIDPDDAGLADLLRRAMATQPQHRPSAAEVTDVLARLASEYRRREAAGGYI